MLFPSKLKMHLYVCGLTYEWFSIIKKSSVFLPSHLRAQGWQFLFAVDVCRNFDFNERYLNLVKSRELLLSSMVLTKLVDVAEDNDQISIIT